MPFIVACTQRSAADQHAAVLANYGLLRKYLIGTRRPTPGIPEKLTCMNPAWGAAATAAAMVLPRYKGEWVRAAIHPWFDAWAKRHVRPDDHVISSYGYANDSFKKARSLGGKTLLEAGNSHPSYFWDVISEEHRIWGVKQPPYPPHWNRQGKAMLDHTDFVICPSRYVENTYLERGWGKERLLYAPYPTDLAMFKPDQDACPPVSPLWVICTGSVSLRKGFPYLFEAIRLLRKDRDVRLMLTNQVEEVMSPILATYPDIPIDWSPTLAHPALAARLRSAHVFALLSLEDGFARTVTEALACGIPAVVTTNTGAMDFVVEGENGYVVPIRDAQAAAEAISKSFDIRVRGVSAVAALSDLSFSGFEKQFMSELKRVGLVP